MRIVGGAAACFSAHAKELLSLTLPVALGRPTRNLDIGCCSRTSYYHVLLFFRLPVLLHPHAGTVIAAAHAHASTMASSCASMYFRVFGHHERSLSHWTSESPMLRCGCSRSGLTSCSVFVFWVDWFHIDCFYLWPPPPRWFYRRSDSRSQKVPATTLLEGEVPSTFARIAPCEATGNRCGALGRPFLLKGASFVEFRSRVWALSSRQRGFHRPTLLPPGSTSEVALDAALQAAPVFAHPRVLSGHAPHLGWDFSARSGKRPRPFYIFRRHRPAPPRAAIFYQWDCCIWEVGAWHPGGC